jgi:tetratricopeptide (TPR) repeat protein
MSYLPRWSTQRLVLSAVAVLFSLLVSGPVLAASKKSDKQARESAARAACLDGNYAEGVAILSKLFVESKDATYIFNQGRCFEQNRRYEDAISRFQEYLRAGRKSLEANDKAEAEQHINDCRDMLAQERGASPPPSAPPPLVASPAPLVSPQPTPPTPAPQPMISESAPKPASTSGGARLRIGGIVVASFGVVAAGVGLAFNLMANSTVNDMYNTTDGYTKESSRKNYETVAWVGYGVGAACVVTGVILYAIGRRAKSSHSNDVALVPMVGRDHAGAAFAGAF